MLGKVKPWDALLYPIFQTLGGLAGALPAKFALGRIFTEEPVNYVVTVPRKAGVATAFVAEVIIACGMMLMVLFMTNTLRLARFTGIFGDTLVFLYITFEAPLSGMSINPARTIASALPSGIWTAGWIYFARPSAACYWPWNLTARRAKGRKSPAQNGIMTCPTMYFLRPSWDSQSSKIVLQCPRPRPRGGMNASFTRGTRLPFIAPEDILER